MMTIRFASCAMCSINLITSSLRHCREKWNVRRLKTKCGFHSWMIFTFPDFHFYDDHTSTVFISSEYTSDQLHKGLSQILNAESDKKQRKRFSFVLSLHLQNTDSNPPKIDRVDFSAGFFFSSFPFASHSAMTFASCICCSSRCFLFAAIFLLLHHLRSKQPRAGRLSSHLHYALMHSVLRNLFARSSLSLSTLFLFSHRIDCFSSSSWNSIMRIHIENWKTITDSNCFYMQNVNE